MSRLPTCVFMGVSLLVLAGCASWRAQRETEPRILVAEGGQARCAIVLPEGAPKDRMALAQELQHWLREVTGATLPIEVGVGEGDTPRGPRPAGVTNRIILATSDEVPGVAAQTGPPYGQESPESSVRVAGGDCLYLVGGSELGLQEAVYGFLEEIGCRWLFPDPVWTVLPKRSTLRVGAGSREGPAFAYRRIWYGWGPRTPTLQKDYDAWLKHNRQLGAFTTDCGHAYERYVPARLFKEHPDWFALVKGERKPTQLCVSNPEVQQRVSEEVLKLFRKDPKRNMASVEPNDGGGYCECARCKALGPVSDGVFHLASDAAKALRKEFPDKWVGLYAYAFHCDPPRFPIEPGVYVQVTTGFRYTKLSFEEQVAAFRKLGAKLGVYDYFSVYPWDWDLPGAAKGSRVYQLADSIRHYRALGLSTYDAESGCNWGPNGLGYWVAAKLMWDPDRDPKALVADFCTSAFGKAAEPMRRLYERWATGERFSRRGLKLGLLDLQEAYQLEGEPAVKARLDRVAMYLHWLRLWLDYERGTRLRGDNKDDVIRSARELIVFSARLMDTGLIHTYPMLFSEWFERRFNALLKLPGFDPKQAEAWKKERTDIPTGEEVARNFADDLKSVEGLTAVETGGRDFSAKLVPAAERFPQAVRAWGEVKRSPLFVESGLHCFAARKGEALQLTLTPFDPGHTVKGHWKMTCLRDVFLEAEGDVAAEKGKEATLRLTTDSDDLFFLDPGTGYWRTAEVGFEPRPLSVWAGRADEPGQPKRPEFRLWRPQLDQPLYFLVPKGTRHFVIGLPSIGQELTTLVLRTADGATVLEDKGVLAGDQISVVVPPGRDGAVWSLALSSLRCVVELYGVPPYLARHPRELLVPE